MELYAVRERRGGPWDWARGLREQAGFGDHARFMDELVETGFVLLGGPLEGDREVLLVVSAASADAIRERLAADPWLQDGTLSIVSIERWTILLDGTGGGHVNEDQAASDGSAAGPICPHCERPLRGSLRQEQVMPQEANGAWARLAVAVTYCGSCGWTLDVAPAQAGFPGRPGLMAFEEVAAPADGQTLEGQFQLRCRELIGQARSLGFDPNVWVAMINDLGAAGAARKLLADHHVLVVTPWLVRRGRPELTLEHEIGQPAWADLFSDAERAEAARRLAHSPMGPRKRRGWLRRRGPSSARRP